MRPKPVLVSFSIGRNDEPIGVLKHDRMVGVMVSVQDFEAMRTFYADRLQHRLNASAIAAERAGLTAEKLDSLLADES